MQFCITAQPSRDAGIAHHPPAWWMVRPDRDRRGDQPPDLDAAFAAHPGSREQWDAFPRSARRAILEWIVQARTEPTRAKRIAETAEKAAAGERANQWRPKS